MTEEQIALARRAVACRGWRWLPGMRALSAARGKLQAIRVCDDIREWVAHKDEFPDLQDPATLGCLLALVREAHGAPFLQVSVSISREHGYRFECNPRHRGAWVESEEEALVAALEAAQ